MLSRRDHKDVELYVSSSAVAFCQLNLSHQKCPQSFFTPTRQCESSGSAVDFVEVILKLSVKTLTQGKFNTNELPMCVNTE